MLISEEYREQLAQKHQSSSNFGKEGCQFVDNIAQLAQSLGTEDILDYGCGKGSLQLHLPFDIKQYDPAIPKYATPPQPAMLVVCTDVLEHIEPHFLDAVIQDLVRVTKAMLFVNIPAREALKKLPDGRNTHLTVKPVEWWIRKMWEHGWFWANLTAEPGMTVTGSLVHGATGMIGKVNEGNKTVDVVREMVGSGDA